MLAGRAIGAITAMRCCGEDPRVLSRSMMEKFVTAIKAIAEDTIGGSNLLRRSCTILSMRNSRLKSAKD